MVVNTEISNAHIILLQESNLLVRSEDLVEAGEGALGPDDEATKVTAGRELEDVQPSDLNNLNAGQVPKGFNNAIVFVVDNERAAALTVPAVPHLANTRAKLARVRHLGDVGICPEALEELDCLLGLGQTLSRAGNDQGNLINLLNAMAAGENKRRQSRSSECGDDGKATLILVHLDVPFAPDLGGREHATTTTHVTKGSLQVVSVTWKSFLGTVTHLSRTVSTTTSYTGNTGDSTTSTPRLSASLVSGLHVDSVGLPLVLSNALYTARSDVAE
jgi:hypothetical protein